MTMAVHRHGASHDIPGASPFSHHIVPNGEARIRVTACGQGMPIVLLPSLGRDVEDFFPIARDLAAAGWRVLMPSPRGMGGSVGPLAGIRLHDLASDIAAVIEHERAGPALVAGHAFGNWVARTTAADHPSLVAGVAILAAAHKHFPASLRASIDAAMDASLPTETRLTHLRTAFFASGSDPSVWLDGWHPAIARAQRAASAATVQSAWWAAGAAPLLDVQASEDAFAPRAGAHLLRQELGPRVRIATIENAGHALLPEQPRDVAAALVAFAQTLERRN